MAIGSLRPAGSHELIAFATGTLAADVALAGLVGLLYASADAMVTRLGEQGARAVTSLSSLLLLCIGVQILVLRLHDTWLSNAPH
jgi:multiple antibiotic resistance protein